jgi:hypothetical protein
VVGRDDREDAGEEQGNTGGGDEVRGLAGHCVAPIVGKRMERGYLNTNASTRYSQVPPAGFPARYGGSYSPTWFR